jgi:hypothetical protein
MKYFLSIVVLILVVSPLLAQEPWEKESELEGVEIEIVKDREIVLPKANRNFEKIPPTTFAQGEDGLEYFFNTIRFPLPLLDIRMRPLRVKDAALEKTYGNYVRGGLGNFGTTYLEAYLNSKRDRNYSYGTHINWFNQSRGAVRDKDSGSGLVEVDLFGKYFTQNITYSASAGMSRQSVKFYGVPEPIEEVDKQVYQSLYLKGGMTNTNPSDIIQYAAGLRVNLLNDDYDARETELEADLKTSVDISDQVIFYLNSDLSLIGRKGDTFDSNGRTLFRVSPAVGFEYEGFRIRAGMNAVFENDTLSGFDKLHVYPDAMASYTFNEQIDLYAGITGDIVKNTLRTMSNENAFIGPDQPIYHSNKTFSLYGGIKGKLSPELGFEAGFSASNYKNMHFFLNDTTREQEFDIIYDRGNTALVNIHGSLGYSRSDEWSVHVRGDYWGYGTSDIGEAWHRPNYKLTATAFYNLFDKIRLNGEFYTTGGIKSYDFTTDQVVNLKTAFDLNLLAEYLFSSQVSAFVQLNNIFSREYELYYRYPVRGFQFMVGASYSF